MVRVQYNDFPSLVHPNGPGLALSGRRTDRVFRATKHNTTKNERANHHIIAHIFRQN